MIGVFLQSPRGFLIDDQLCLDSTMGLLQVLNHFELNPA